MFRWTEERWRKNEVYDLRILQDEWKPLPLELRKWLNSKGLEFDAWMYAHMSEDMSGMVAYFPTESAFDRDRPVRTTIGRALAKVKNVPAHVAAEASQILNNEIDTPELLFARTEEEIEYVYLNGPSSCMAHDVDDYSTDGIHPTRVYATEDVGVAYIKNKRNRISARTVVNMKDKLYCTIYGTSSFFEELLEKEGYTCSEEALVDCKLLHLLNDDGMIICPYLDGNYTVSVYSDKYLIVNEEGMGDYAPYETSGLLEEYCGYVCDQCGENSHEELTTVISAGEWCSDCVDNAACWSDYEDGYIPLDDSVYIEDVGSVFSSTAAYCEYNDTYILSSESLWAEYSGGGTWAHEDDVVEDAITGRAIVGDMLEHPNGFTLVPEDEWEEEAA